MSPLFYEFGRFRVDAGRRVLLREGQPVALSPKVFDTLLELIRRRGHVATKDELMAAVWGDTVVEENSLARNISLLRKLLGETASDHEYIVTVPGKGYSFVAPAREIATLEPECVGAAVITAGETAPAASRYPRKWMRLGVLTTAAAALAVTNLGRTHSEPFQTTTMMKLTSAGWSHKAAISPDGRYVAHTVIRSDRESLLVRGTSSLHDVEIVPPSAVNYLGITFSPDSESVYYVTRTAGAAPAVLYRVPVIGGAAEKVKEDLASAVTFSPDGRKIAFVRELPDTSAIVIADLESGRETTLVSRRLPEVLDYPAWSPDGRSLACTLSDSSKKSPRGSGTRIIELRISDRSSRALSSLEWPFIRGLAWLSDGRGLLMTARDQESGLFHVWHVSYPGGSARKITSGLSSQTGVAVSADGRRIVTVDERRFAGIWRLATAQDDPVPVVFTSSDSCGIAWAPDGRIIFDQNLDNHLSIWSIGLDGRNQKQLTAAGNNYMPSLSKNGRTLAYISDSSGTPAIWTMDVGGGNATKIVGADGGTQPQLSPDGTWMAYAAIASGHWPSLWRVARAEGHPLPVNPNLWLRPAISPDGKWIAGFYAADHLSTQREPFSLAVVPVSGGESRNVSRIAPSVLTSAGIQWTRDGREITYADHAENGTVIWNQPADGGERRRVARILGDVVFSFDWSPDGRELVFSRGAQARDVVLIEEGSNVH